MAVARLILDYLQVFLSGPVIAGAVAFAVVLTFKREIATLLVARAVKIKYPGGEIEVTQLEKVKEAEAAPAENKPVPVEPQNVEPGQLPQSLTPEQVQAVKQLLASEKARSALWEYRFLNGFLVRTTQAVLDWLAERKEPVSIGFFHDRWSPFIPAAERHTILEVLDNHYLIRIDGELLSITPKGREYVWWRGPLPSPPVPSVAPLASFLPPLTIPPEDMGPVGTPPRNTSNE